VGRALHSAPKQAWQHNGDGGHGELKRDTGGEGISSVSGSLLDNACNAGPWVDINQGAGEDWIIVFCLGLACISCAPTISA
jgi:hypothetical protein